MQRREKMEGRFLLMQDGESSVLTFETLRGAVNYVRVEFKCNKQAVYIIKLEREDGNTQILFTLSPTDKPTIDRMLNDYMVW